MKSLLSAIPRNTERGLKYAALFSMYLLTARRRSEILNLRWKDLKKEIVIDNDGTRREAWTFSWYGKGFARVQDRAELPGTAATALFKYLEFSGRLAVMQPEHALFTADTTHIGRGGYNPLRPLSPQAVLDAVKKYARLACIEESRVNIHVFHHVSARERFSAGSDIREIQQVLRHSSLATTDIYLRALTSTADPGAALLEKRFGKL